MRLNLIIWLMVWANGAASQISYPSNTWIPIEENCKYGFIDPSGKIRIQPAYEHVSTFQEGLAFVWSFPGYKQDRKNVELGKDYVNYERFNLEGNRKTGIIDSTGKYVVEPKLNFEFFSNFQDGVALVEIDNEIVFIDRKGNVLEYYDPVLAEDRMKEVRRIAQFGEALPRKYCFVDASRRPVIYPFDEVKPFYGGLAAVRLGTHFGYVDEDGNMKITPQFKKAGYFSNGYATVAITMDNGDNTTYRYGVIDSTGSFVVPPVYEFLDDPSNGHVVYGIETGDRQKFGIIDLKGKIVLKAAYDELGKYAEGLIPVKIKNNYGYVDLKGNIVIPAKYEYALPFKYGAAIVRLKDDKNMIIDRKGNVIWGPYGKKDC